MILRHVGHRVQTLEAGPYTFLLSDSIPVAYRDLTEGEKYFRTDTFFSKGTSAHLNEWLRHKPVQLVAHTEILRVFQGLSRYSDVPDRRDSPGRRAEDNGVSDDVKVLAEALAKVLKR